MIIIEAGPVLGTPPDAPGSRWVSLARRGMLWSEVQVFDVSALGPGVTVSGNDDAYLQVLYCVLGVTAVTRDPAAPATLPAGYCLICPPSAASTRLTAGPDGAVLVRARLLPAAAAGRLPRRYPSLSRPTRHA